MAGGRPFKWIPGDPEVPGEPRAHSSQPGQACQAALSGPAMDLAGAGGRWYPPSGAPEPIDRSPHARIDAGGMPMGAGQAQRGAVAAQQTEQIFSFAEGEPAHFGLRGGDPSAEDRLGSVVRGHG